MFAETIKINAKGPYINFLFARKLFRLQNVSINFPSFSFFES